MVAVGGSYNGDTQNSTTIDVFTPSGWRTSTTRLPRPSSWGCAVAVNATAYFIIGGYDEVANSYQNNTYIFDLTSNTIRAGPPFPVQKKLMACSRMTALG